MPFEGDLCFYAKMKSALRRCLSRKSVAPGNDAA
jgi:hypothetical protein